ncbi:flagellar basal body P-ring protein FlgI [Plasticicumulans acidivorans]|uniref:Flagellar P-ring protein n=1 Tax=Plasticicumulans acidivorans TaxID=886464 RepID=A0A317MXR7_9GAMM|nr:flagellar basal body P-ring protein FlgI [Plasticicumulans acidivorans]PWV63314.1 flagellar P-ring protein precursor FlgI [Plasticicumulans acidivorans]
MNRAPKLLKPLLIALALGLSGPAAADRVKDLATVGGVRSNQLVGYGLVVGLAGTGDQTSQTPFTVQSMRNMLTGLGVVLPANINLQLKNVAAVSVHADLPAFAKPGQTIDITVSSLGNAKSLRGGSLLLTPLRGADGEVYAMAQGNVVVGGLGVEGEGSSITVNVPSAGRIANGATVERAVPDALSTGNGALTLNLHQPDFTTAERLAQAINRKLGGQFASALDAATVQIEGPRDPRSRVPFIAELENIDVKPAEGAAKVIINSRTGTVVVGNNVRLFPAAVTHGKMTVTISADPVVSQPNALSNGQTVVVPRQNIDVKEEKRPMFLFNPGTKLEDIVRAVNQVGASPSDLAAILEALKAAGALRAELIVI